MMQIANNMPESYKKSDRLITKHYDYLRDSVMQVGFSGTSNNWQFKQKILFCRKNMPIPGKQIPQSVARGSAPQIIGEIVKNRLTHNGNIRPIFSFDSGFVDFAKTDMLIWICRQS